MILDCDVCDKPAAQMVTFDTQLGVQSFTVCTGHAAEAVGNGAVVTEL